MSKGVKVEAQSHISHPGDVLEYSRSGSPPQSAAWDRQSPRRSPMRVILQTLDAMSTGYFQSALLHCPRVRHGGTHENTFTFPLRVFESSDAVEVRTPESREPLWDRTSPRGRRCRRGVTSSQVHRRSFSLRLSLLPPLRAMTGGEGIGEVTSRCSLPLLSRQCSNWGACSQNKRICPGPAQNSLKQKHSKKKKI
uniref:Uncharacterized protein n=1 Tax=Timema tahoe TaxID=61484 RepID=A0A7R9NYH5_9NEOP|nr:unnamed protein product [Timema tahoe]